MALRDFISFVVENIVNHKDQVKIEEKDENGSKTVSINTAKEDIGLIVGRGGRRIKAIRRLAGIIGAKEQKKVFIELEG